MEEEKEGEHCNVRYEGGGDSLLSAKAQLNDKNKNPAMKGD